MDELGVPYGPGDFDLKRMRRPRMNGFDYTGLHTYHLVALTRERRRVLRGGLAAAISHEIRRAGEAASFDILAFVVMPDHVHMLAQAATEDSDAIRFVQRFKQATGFRYKQTV